MVCTCRYTVESHMAGYMPDNPPDCYRTLSAAHSGAQWWADRFREDDQYKVTGNSHDGYTAIRNPQSAYTLPYYINIHDVGECGCNDCNCEDCQ
jgi:hypothetical protein